MRGQKYLALAVLAYMEKNREAFDEYMAKAAEFGDDLTQFVDQVVKIGNTATRNDVSTPHSENTISPSLRAAASSFVESTSRVSKQLAIAAYLDDDEFLEEEQADESFDELDDLETDVDGFDEDEEATASTGPIRYKQ